ncbi:MAG TPA: flagellar hook-basal body complex protein FliE [Synergistaceae bacterium]|nr:flagellar hook-basal body complex protein FliE [Synergistaceae bacterium]
MKEVRVDLSQFHFNIGDARLAKAGSDSKREKGFEELLKDNLQKVNDLQFAADEGIEKLATGEAEDISQVVIAVQEAEVALRLLVEIRNKLVDAYQQLARMPV